MLIDEVDFERLRTESPIRLLIATTRVKDGRLRLFRENEMTVEAVLASSCLPFLHHAIEIDGEAYWDGGYAANPPLRQLVSTRGPRTSFSSSSSPTSTRACRIARPTSTGA